MMRVLHIAGSSESAFFHDLSLLYARDVLQPEGVEAGFVTVEPGGGWRFGESLECLGEGVDAAEAIGRIAADPPDLVVPHLFDAVGMTTYRGLFEDVLGIPVVGSRPETTAVAARKSWTNAVLAQAGLDVPEGVVHRAGEPLPDLSGPLVVKPDTGDNSEGLSLVREWEGLAQAIELARAVDNDVLIERLVPGRELRLCVVEMAGELVVPAVMEYPLDPDSPIRAADDKLHVEGGRVVGQTRKASAKPVLPADLSSELRERSSEAARRAHRALGCRHYSLWDLRLREGTDEIVFLEAGLFWAFSEISMVSRMLAASGYDVREVVGELWRAAAA